MGKAFGTAGVRGVFNKTQTPELVCALAETVAFTFGKGIYAVGWDGRKVSALLAKVVSSAVNAVGSDVLSFGRVPTPVVAFGTASRSCKSGFAITASHNPPEFSGVKLFSKDGMEFSKVDEERVERVLGLEVRKGSNVFGRSFDDQTVLEDYISSLVARQRKVRSPLRIAVDCGNGPGGDVTPTVLRRLGHEVKAVNSQVSWRFPARLPEPTPSTLSDFCSMIPRLGVDLAFAHDGDADRLVLIDREGKVVTDSILTILAMRGLGLSRGSVIISENTSNAVAEEAASLGLRVVRSRVGKSFVSLKSEGGVFASEPSKIVDPAWGPWEDGINAAALLSVVLSEEMGLLQALSSTVRWKYRQVNIERAVNFRALTDNAREAFRRYGIVEERFLDGYRLNFVDGSWVMFRPSGTEPKTRIYCESQDSLVLDQITSLARQCIESSL